MEEKIKLGRLVESWSKGFGRIIHINDLGFAVEFGYLSYKGNHVVVYGLRDISVLKFYNDAETAYL